MDNIIPPPSPPLDHLEYFDEYANGHSNDHYNEYSNGHSNGHHQGQKQSVKQEEVVRYGNYPYEIKPENLTQAYQYDQFIAMLAQLHAGGSWSYLWHCSEERKGRTLKSGKLSYTEAKSKKTIWFPIGQVPTLSFNEGMNVYFGVHPANKSGKPYQRALKNSSKDVPVVKLANCLFAEFDAKDFSQPLMDVSKSYKQCLKDGQSPFDFDARGTEHLRRHGMNAAWRHIQQIGIKPTYMVNSGGGFHAYFLFNEPYEINDQTREEFERLQAQFVSAVGSDDGAKDLARVLRVPGTINFKGYYEDQRMVFVIPDENRAYHDLDDIRAFVTQKEAQSTLFNPATTTSQSLKPKSTKATTTDENSPNAQKAGQALKRLSKSRGDSYNGWLNVGMALYHEFGGANWARMMWDNWSQQSDTYEAGATEAKWETFQKDESDRKLGLGSLILWANSDDPKGQKAPKKLVGLDALLARINAIDSALELTDKIDDMVDLALELTSRELTKACKAMRKKGVKSADTSQWRRDVKEAKAEAKEQEEACPAQINGYTGLGSIIKWANDDAPSEQAPKHVNMLVFEVNDAGNADAFREAYGHIFRHVTEWGWLTYNGVCWERRDADKRLFILTKEVLRRRVEAVLRLGDEDKLKSYLRNCAPTTKNVNAALTQIKHDLDLSGHPDKFDSHDFLINVANGVFDIRAGTLTPHDPTLMITSCLRTEYNPNADTSLITNFLSKLGLSSNVISYLQQATGYTLTGSTREECLFFIYGPTRSGKGSFIGALKSLMGSTLAAEISFDTLTGGKRDNADAQNFALAPLKPCRLVIASESGRYSTLNEAKVKQITGGDSIYCAFKGKTHFNYKPDFKVWLISNHPPKADVNDDAIWKSRLKLIEFPNSFLGQEDKGLKDALMNDKEYQEALLLWALRGAYKWYHSTRGLEAPPEVVEATQAARDQLDYVRQWLDECTEDDADARVTNAVLYASYETWCDENGVNAKKKRSFSRDMSSKGYKKEIWKFNNKTVRGFCRLNVT